ESRPVNNTQASIVRFVGCRLGASGTWTELLVPSKLNAEPMKPAPLAVAVPVNVPLLVPAMSLAFPSAGHQLTTPAGIGKHPAPAARKLVTSPRESHSATSQGRPGRKESPSRLPRNNIMISG